MDSLFSKASSSIQSAAQGVQDAAQSAARSVQDSVARSPSPTRRRDNTGKTPPPFFKTSAAARRAGVFPSQPLHAKTVNSKEFWEEPYDYTKGARFIGPAINDGGAVPERKDQRGLYVRVRLKGGEPPADGFTSPPPPPLPTEVNDKGQTVPRTKFSQEEWDKSQQELDERLEAMGFEPTYHANIRKQQREEAKHTKWEVDHGPRQAQWADYLREHPNPFKDRPDLFPTHLGRPRHDPLGGEPSMFEHLFKNKDGTDKRPFTIVHEDEFQRIVEQNAREEEGWEPKEPEPGWEVTDHPSVAEEARIAAEDAQAALSGKKLEFGNDFGKPGKVYPKFKWPSAELYPDKEQSDSDDIDAASDDEDDAPGPIENWLDENVPLVMECARKNGGDPERLKEIHILYKKMMVEHWEVFANDLGPRRDRFVRAWPGRNQEQMWQVVWDLFCGVHEIERFLKICREYAMQETDDEYAKRTAKGEMHWSHPMWKPPNERRRNAIAFVPDGEEAPPSTARSDSTASVDNW